MTREEHAPLSENLVLQLSRFFRYSLESDEKMVPLGREISLLRDYMNLQEMRFGDRIMMDIESDPSLESIPVPKFILQPLVENAIIHGLRACTHQGLVQVAIRKKPDAVAIYVMDNGCGFRVNAIPAHPDRKSVGIVNIRERVEYMGGSLRLFSVLNVGTCARIIIPVKKEEASENA